MGYHLPKGASAFTVVSFSQSLMLTSCLLAAVITNTWGIGRDTAIFPDPEVFRPSRYLGAECKKIEKLLSKGHTGTSVPGTRLRSSLTMRRSTGFGHARRICRKPGGRLLLAAGANAFPSQLDFILPTDRSSSTSPTFSGASTSHP